MNDSELVGILNNQISNATGGYTSTINDKKATALDYYMGDESLIDAEDGESSVITREVLENVERELGQQLKVFASGERVVQFDPTGEEDEEQAEQETDYVLHIYNKENNGFKISHDWIKSALIEKVSYVKVWVEENEETEVQTYTNLLDIELAQALDQDEVEALEHSERLINLNGIETTVHDIKIRVTEKKKRIKIAAVPGEEIGVARNHNELSLEDCHFVYHKPQGVTASDLIEAGFDKKTVMELPGYSEAENELETSRNYSDDEATTLYDEADASTREIEVYECYIRMDYDGDGIAELRKVTISGDKVLENEECDFIPFASLCPLPMPHKHVGLSYADMLMELQDVKTVLTQQILTNLYFTNLPELEVVEKQIVNIDDFLLRKSGSLKRVTAPGTVNPLVVPFTAGASIPMLDVLDGMIERRVGRSRPLDPEVLAKTTGMAFAMGQEQDAQLSEKLARTFAETGFKELFGMIHELAIKNSDKEQIIRLRNKYVPVNPTEWKHRENMTVVVGLGTGNQEKEATKLMALAEKQEAHLQMGSPLVTMKNVYNTYAKLVERIGLKEPSLYFTDPESEEAQQTAMMQAQNQQPDPNMLLIQSNMQIEQDKRQVEREKAQLEAELKVREQDLKERELALKEAQMQLDAQTDAAQIEATRYKTDMDAETKMAVEQLKAGLTIQEAIKNSFSEANQRNDEVLTQAINGILAEIETVRNENAVAISGISDNLSKQVSGLASKMGKPKNVVYDDDGNPIRIE
jgi:hypothetical protein